MKNNQKKFHASRRKELAKLIGKDSIAIIFGNTVINKSFDGNYQFKQFKNFYYLTGFKEPEAALVIAPNGIKFGKQEKKYNEILYVRPKDKQREIWDGARVGFENVNKELGINKALENTRINNLMNIAWLRNFTKVYINFGEMLKLTQKSAQWVRALIDSLNIIAAHAEVIDISYIMAKLRREKTKEEIEKMKKAAEITINSYNKTMKEIKPGVPELKIQALLEYNYKSEGSEDIAYHPIVASGENACTLHYELNNGIMKDGEILTIDSGAEFEYYCCDITRSFPINGKFTKEQKEIYEIVLRANKECIKRIKPGVSFNKLSKFSWEILSEGLFKLGILKDKKKIGNYAVHGLGHHIGLDTHDAVQAEKKLGNNYEILRPGNIITVEPGLYFRNDMKEIPKKYRDIGIRIEDVVLVTKSGNINLTEKMVKEVRDVEHMMKKD